MSARQVFQFGGPCQDQRLEVRDDGVYVFDWSGDSPETTDDGPLRVESKGRCSLTVFGEQLSVRVPVLQLRTGHSVWVSMSLACFEVLRTHVPELSLDRSPEYCALARMVLWAEKLHVEMD